MKLERNSLRDSFNVHLLMFRKYKFQPYDVTGSQGSGSSRLEVKQNEIGKETRIFFRISMHIIIVFVNP